MSHGFSVAGVTHLLDVNSSLSKVQRVRSGADYRANKGSDN